jgi:DNA-binding cell septation regulator SpoVG
MKVTRVKIKRIIPVKGHVAFASCIIDNWLYLNNIAIFTRLNNEENIRLVFPEKKVGEKKVSIFHPLSSDSYFELERAILSKLKEL